MKKIVIVGGRASVAQRLIPELLNDANVISIGRRNCDIYCDLSKSLNEFVIPRDVDTLIHIAACNNGDSDEEIINTEDVNALGTLKICIAAEKSGIKHLIIISSMYATLDENSPYFNIYSLSKKHAEELAVYYCKLKKMPLTIIRPSQIYDEIGSFRKHQPLLYLMADNAETGNDIIIFGANDAKRNYIHINDLTEIIRRVVKTKCTGIYSCISPEDVKLSDMAKAAFSAFGKGGKCIFNGEKKDIQNNTFPKDLNLNEKIEFYPKIDINEGMKKIYKYRRGINHL